MDDMKAAAALVLPPWGLCNTSPVYDDDSHASKPCSAAQPRILACVWHQLLVRVQRVLPLECCGRRVVNVYLDDALHASAGTLAVPLLCCTMCVELCTVHPCKST